MIDPTGWVITTLRDAMDDAGQGDRVRGREPAPGDVQSKGSFNRFVIVDKIDFPPDPRLPFADAHFSFRAYGTDPHDAFLVYATIVGTFHAQGPWSVPTSGLGVYLTQVDGGADGTDPANQQPYVEGVIRLIATTQAVAV